MLGDNTRNLVLFGLTSSLALAMLVQLLRGARHWHPWSRLRHALGSARDKLRESWRRETDVEEGLTKVEEDEVSLRVKAKLDQLKIDHFRWVCKCLYVALALLNLQIIANIVLGITRGFTVMQDVMHILMTSVVFYMANTEGLVMQRTIDPLYAFFVICTSLAVLPWFCKPPMAMPALLICNLMMTLLGLARRSMRSVIPANIVLTATSCCTIFVHGITIGRIASLAMVQVIFTLTATLGAHFLGTSLKETIRQGLEVQVAKELLHAASALLRSCCDVVVELDSEGRISKSAVELSSFLLRGPSRRLLNARLADLISHEDDKEKFLRKLFTPRPPNTEMAEALHVRMRDGNDSVIRTQVLWFRFPDLDGHSRYMVGIREFSDASTVGNLMSETQLRQTAVPGADDDAASSFMSEESSASCSILTEMEEMAVLTIDSTVQELEVQSSSQAFCKRVGRVAPGSSFSRIVKSPERFRHWLQESVNALLEGQPQVQPCHVTLNMRHGKMRGMCRVQAGVGNGSSSSSSEDTPKDVVDIESVHLHFFGLQQCRGRSVGPRRRSVCPTSPRGSLHGTPANRGTPANAGTSMNHGAPSHMVNL